MSDNGDEQARRLLDESVAVHHFDAEAKRPRAVTRARSGWVSLGFVVLVALLTLPFLGYMRRASTSASTPPKQLAIPLYPEKHVSRRPTTLEFRWNVTLGTMAPDGVEKQVYLVNGAFPGPTIEARSGDRIVVHVHNGLKDEELALHWHGLQMKGHNSMDGAIGFTQCPITGGRDFTYDFTIGDDEHGTFWWHSHAQLQRGDGLYGGLVVHQPGSSPGSSPGSRPEHDDALVLVGDWFHRKQTDVFDWYFDWGSIGSEPVPDSLLVNGRGRYDCSMAVPARPVVCTQQSSDHLLPLLRRKPKDTAVRLRVVNTGTVAGVTLSADGATMQPVAVDGGFAVGGTPGRSVGILYPGERADLLVKWEDGGNDQFHVRLDEENFGGFPNPALNTTHSFNLFPLQRRQENSPPIIPPDLHRDLNTLTAATPTTLAPQAQETIVLYFKTQMLSRFQNKPKGFVNNTSWEPQDPPLLVTDRSLWDADQFVPYINSSTRDVDIVINNLDDGSHPIHLHGYSFYVLSSFRADGRGGWGSYNPYESKPLAPVNLVDPVRKDTVSVPRRGHVVIRLRPDNPGVWMMHCHMLVHMGTGMVMGLQVGEHVAVADRRCS